MAENLNSDDYYEVLGVPRGTEPKEIKSVYKKLAKKYHPDLHQNEKQQYAEHFKKISEAYEVLSDDEKRKIYDQHGKAGLKPEHHTFKRPEDIFAEVFSQFGFNNFGFQFGSHPQEEPVVKYPIDVSYKNLYKGKTIKFKISRQHIIKNDQTISSSECLACHQQCPECHGQGRKITTVRLNFAFATQQVTNCAACRGYGKILQPDYTYKQMEEIVQLDIKPGSKEGQRYVLSEKGDMIPGQPILDVHVIIHEVPDDHCQRQGSDLYWEYQIGLGDALAGSTILFEHLDGQKYNLSFNTTIQSGDKKCVPGLGFPDLNCPTRKGNLYLIFKVIFPKTIDDKCKQKLRQLLPISTSNPKYETHKLL